MNRIPVSLIAEGPLDEEVLRRLLAQSAPHLQANVCYGKRGRGWMDANMSKYNIAARHWPCVALADLEQAECPPALLCLWFPRGKHANLQARIAVRMVEAWLLADRDACAEFLGVPVRLIPQFPDYEAHPKQMMVNLARRSRFRTIRDDLVPSSGSTGLVGKNYWGKMGEFVNQKWQSERARLNSPSLQRAIQALQQFYPAISES